MRTLNSSLMDLTVNDGEVVSWRGDPFDRVAYSRFKYGFLPPAVDYGYRLAALVASRLWEMSAGQPVRIVSAPYKYLPTASHAVADYMCQELGRRAVEQGLEPPVLVPFHKSRTGSSAYAQSSEADRLKSLATLGLHIDESLVTGCHVLVVDDIRITGSAEKATAAYLESLHPASIWYLHAARLSEDAGRANPGLEDELNQTVKHSLSGILAEVEEGTFQLNTRVLRHILESETNAFVAFVNLAPVGLLKQIHAAGVGSGISYYQRHLRNLEIVNSEIQWQHAGQLVPAQ